MSDIKDTFLGVTKNITKSSSHIVKTTKLSLKMSSEEDNLKNIYMEIGKKVHEIYSYGGSLGAFFDEKYSEIRDAEEKIAEIKKALEVAKGVKPCPKCNKPMERNVVFCPHCGYSISEKTVKIEIDEKVKPEINHAKTCQICGSENDKNEKFCLKCGRLI